MGKIKNLLIEVQEALTSSNMDYDLVANEFGMTVSEVVQIAKDYGDIDDTEAP